MARIQNSVSAQPMGRGRITSPSKDAVKDNGTTLISIVAGEQIQIQLTVGWLTNLADATITAKIVEGQNTADGAVPTGTAIGASVTTLVVLDETPTDNVFKLVIPETLIDSWVLAPTAVNPVYGFIGLEIADGGVGDAKQVWKPLRGLVEVLYSPSEA